MFVGSSLAINGGFAWCARAEMISVDPPVGCSRCMQHWSLEKEAMSSSICKVNIHRTTVASQCLSVWDVWAWARPHEGPASRQAAWFKDNCSFAETVSSSPVH